MPSNTRWFVLVLLTTSSILLFFHLPASSHPAQPKPLSQSFTSLPGSDDEVEPGIGFDLSAFYGTVAVSFGNGSTHAIAKVDASDWYRETWKRLSLRSSMHLAPPYSKPLQVWDDWPREELRRWRKKFGLPASPDVGAMAELMGALKEEANKYLGYQITSAAATIPGLPAVYNEDIVDAFEHIGMSTPGIPRYDHLIYHSSSAIAGNGDGLCEHYREPRKCIREQNQFPGEDTVTVLYTREAFASTIQHVAGAYYNYYGQHELFTDLGSAELEHMTEAQKDTYWRRIQAQVIKDWPIRYGTPPRRIFLTGESAGDPLLRQKILEAVATVTNDTMTILGEDPLFANAKGAAEFAKRAPWTSLWNKIPLNETTGSSRVSKPVLVQQQATTYS